MAKAKSKAKTKFWKSDWFVGLVAAIAVLCIHYFSDFTETLERRFYDIASTSVGREPAAEVAIVAIDDASINKIGRWPWSREVHAKVIDDLSAAGAKVIAISMLWTEPQTDRGLSYLRKLKETAQNIEPDSNLAAAVNKTVAEAELALDSDARLAASIAKAGNVVLPSVFELGAPLGRPEGKFPEYISRFLVRSQEAALPAQNFGLHPIPQLASGASAVGHINQLPDVDGSVREEPLLVDSFGNQMASLALLTVARSLNLSNKDIKRSDGLVQVGGLKIKVAADGLFFPQYYRSPRGQPAFATVSFFDVYSGKVAPSAFKDKIIVIGGTAAGVGTQFPTPANPSTFAAEQLAQVTSSILKQHYFVVPHWAVWAAIAASLLVMVYLIVLLPRLSAAMGAIITGSVFVALLVTEYSLLASANLWIKLVLAALMLLVGHLALTTKRFLVTEQGKERSDAESAETNRMMGLALQGQGRLDEAFDRYRRVPLNETHGPAAMENMYNLALDFERKRQFNKAQAVYEYMAAYDKDFKDLQVKLKRAKTLSETVILGGGGSHPGGTMLLGDGSVEKPMLGRYQVEKELGKGAMGVVYLGRDPKIQRVVAIKTMALSQEFEGDELDDARERFFREAETAGRLQHPNIVTIYDAGEEHELAYIAMEFLKGRDLVDYTKDGSLLPPALVVSIAARVADALAYAHQQNVVHRDIKPANIMYEPDADIVKVTDFGIARITDSSKTKTGLVLGTPSFMSPEQIAGKKVDGRSDLYSLGVMLFQMLTGLLPFRGESMAELMYKIANEEAPDIRKIKPHLPQRLADIVALSMSKRPETRYQDGTAFAKDLRAVAAELSMLPDVQGGAGGHAGSASSADKTAVLHAPANFADEKTAVMGARSPEGFEKTAVSRPRADSAGFDKTEVFNRDEQRAAAPESDPFAKTMVSPPPGVRNSGK